ncbi:uncharacterized protein LOC132701811 isoform X2 [Cylas formicarius]|uniref:uncharacterized protein LOC132701811 isoform X2 n=1 Tax=Cylas formicarius TaxID=197179 RepID=UPI002958B4BA|nr:uncharacterized protein LOC132701811 isoform X2 [Cylas formicarius]
MNPVKMKYAVHWETHSKNLTRQFCSLMEHQSLVDVLICCGNNTIQAHKFILAANSPYLREALEKTPDIEQIVIGGCDFSVVKCVIEIMYCGRTVVGDDYVKYLQALFKLFEMKCLENVFADQHNAEVIELPAPSFLTKKPKYPTYSMPPQADGISSNLKAVNLTEAVEMKPFSAKRKLRKQVEQACVKEAQASRLALASLQKEIAIAPQVNSFIIEDSCTETTVENFIPHGGYIEVVDYNGAAVEAATTSKSSVMTDKLKYILGAELPSNVEVVYKDSDGNLVSVTDEVLQNLSTKEGLQYQVIDEDGHVGEVRELHVVDKLDKLIEGVEMIPAPFSKPPHLIGDFLMETGATLSVKGLVYRSRTARYR